MVNRLLTSQSLPLKISRDKLGVLLDHRSSLQATGHSSDQCLEGAQGHGEEFLFIKQMKGEKLFCEALLSNSVQAGASKSCHPLTQIVTLFLINLVDSNLI